MEDGTVKRESSIDPIIDYKIRRLHLIIDAVKVALGTTVVGVATAFSPVIIQSYSTAIERLRIANESTKFDTQNKLDIIKFRQDFLKTFIESGSNQDIEIRWRLADYFAHMADKDSREDWKSYRKNLERQRQDARDEIDKLEREYELLKRNPESDSMTLAQIMRKIRYSYAQMGPIKENQFVVEPSVNVYRVIIYYKLPDNKNEDLAKLSLSIKSRLISRGYITSIRGSDLKEIDIKGSPGQIYIGGNQRGSEILHDLKNALLSIIPQERHKNVKIEPEELEELDGSDAEIYLY